MNDWAKQSLNLWHHSPTNSSADWVPADASIYVNDIPLPLEVLTDLLAIGGLEIVPKRQIDQLHKAFVSFSQGTQWSEEYVQDLHDALIKSQDMYNGLKKTFDQSIEYLDWDSKALVRKALKCEQLKQEVASLKSQIVVIINSAKAEMEKIRGELK